MNEVRDSKKQTPILSINNIIITMYPTVSCCSWRAADCSQNNRAPIDWYVTLIYVDLHGYIQTSSKFIPPFKENIALSWKEWKQQFELYFVISQDFREESRL